MPDSGRSRGGPSTFALTQAEREFLESGSTGGYRRSKLESQIESKKAAIPERFDRLSEDINLLSGQIDKEVWEQFLLQNLPDVEADSLSIAPTELMTSPRPMSPASELGRNFGEIVRNLVDNQEEQDIESIAAQISVGLIRGLYIDQLPVSEIDKHGLDHFISKLGEEMTSFASEMNSERTSFQEMSERRRKRNSIWNQIEGELDRKIRHTLYENDFLCNREDHLLPDPTESGRLLDPKNPEEGLSKWDEYRDSRSYNIVKKTKDYLVADIVQKEIETKEVPFNIIPGSAGTVSIFKDIHNLEDLTIDDIASENKIIEIYSKYNIQDRIELISRLESDASRLNSHQWRGVKATNVLRILDTSGGKMSSRKISQNIDSRKDRTPQVTAITRALSGISYDVQEDWDEHPLLTGEKTGWELTEYGELLAYFVFQDSPMMNKLYDVPIDLVNECVE